MVHGGLSPYSVLITSTGARVLQPLREYDERAAPYRSPEQVRGEAPDWRSDVFAYGALLYEMASGRRAFPGEGAELNDAILEQPPAGLMAKSPIHAAMEGVIAGCLEKDPARRRQRIQNAVIELKLAGRSLQRMAEVRNRSRGARSAGAAAPARERTPSRQRRRRRRSQGSSQAGVCHARAAGSSGRLRRRFVGRWGGADRG